MQRIGRLIEGGFAHGKTAVRLMLKHPVISVQIVIGVGYFGGIVHLYTEHVQKSTSHSIYSKLKSGSKPMQTSLNYTVDRSDVVDKIQKLLVKSDPENGKIGVIVGPKGTGKTYEMIAACNKSPKGIIYKKVNQSHNTPQRLASAVGIPVLPSFADKIEQLFGLESSFFSPMIM